MDIDCISWTVIKFKGVYFFFTDRVNDRQSIKQKGVILDIIKYGNVRPSEKNILKCFFKYIYFALSIL